MSRHLADLELVRAFQRGDQRAFDELVERHYRGVFDLACRLASAAVAADVTQDVFIAAYQALPRFRCECLFRTWLYSIAHHICCRYVTRRPPAAEPLDESLRDEDWRSNPWLAVCSSEAEREVRAAIEKLPPKLRAVVVLRDIHGLSYEEIARVVGCPVGTVRSRLHYATQRLQRHLEGSGVVSGSRCGSDRREEA